MDVMTRAQVLEIVMQQVREVLPHVAAPEIRPEVSLRDLGANSLDRMELVSLAMQALSLRFPVRELAKVSNIGELAEALHQRLPR